MKAQGERAWRARGGGAVSPGSSRSGAVAHGEWSTASSRKAHKRWARGGGGCAGRGAVEAAGCMDVPVSPMMMYLNKYAYDIVPVLRPRSMSGALARLNLARFGKWFLYHSENV